MSQPPCKGMARFLWGMLLVSLAALALAGCGRGGEGEEAPTPTAMPTPSPPAVEVTGPLFVYTKEVGTAQTSDREWPILAVITYDVGARRELASFEIGRVGEYPMQVAIAGNEVVANLEQRVVLYNIDGSNPRVLREVPERGHIMRFSVSPDETKLAVTVGEERQQPCEQGVCRPLPPVTSMAFLDIASGEELLAVPEGAASLAGFRVQAGEITWRDDGEGVVVHGYTYTEARGGTATVLLDGSVRTHDLQDSVLVAPNGRYVEHGTRAPVCEFLGKNEIVLRDLDSQADLASVQGDGSILVPLEWSPDSKELLYATYTALPAREDECHEPGEVWVMRDKASERLYLLRIDGSLPEPVPDMEAVHERWYGNRHVQFRCLGESRRDRWCVDEQGQLQPVEVWVGDTMIGSGEEVQVVGFIDR